MLRPLMFISCKTNLGVAPTPEENNIKTIYTWRSYMYEVLQVIISLYVEIPKSWNEFATVLLSGKKKKKVKKIEDLTLLTP